MIGVTSIFNIMGNTRQYLTCPPNLDDEDILLASGCSSPERN
jgi:hypothetical protein